MKIIKSIALIILLFSLNSLSASEGNTDPKKGQIITELTSLLQKPGISAKGHDLQARVYFMLNRDNEIVVIQVEAESATLEDYIKNRLNYKKVKCNDLNPGMEYMVPVRIKPSI